MLEKLKQFVLVRKVRFNGRWRRRWRVYRVTPRANPRVFRRQLLYAAMLQLKQ
jgi:hypothetical protein